MEPKEEGEQKPENRQMAAAVCKYVVLALMMASELFGWGLNQWVNLAMFLFLDQQSVVPIRIYFGGNDDDDDDNTRSGTTATVAPES